MRYKPVHAWLSGVRFFFDSFFPVRFVAKRYVLQQNLYERTNRNLPASNTLVQLLALYTDPESHNAQCYRQPDGQTDDRMMPIADHTLLLKTGQQRSSCKQRAGKSWTTVCKSIAVCAARSRDSRQPDTAERKKKENWVRWWQAGLEEKGGGDRWREDFWCMCWLTWPEIRLRMLSGRRQRDCKSNLGDSTERRWQHTPDESMLRCLRCLPRGLEQGCCRSWLLPTKQADAVVSCFSIRKLRTESQSSDLSAKCRVKYTDCTTWRNQSKTKSWIQMCSIGAKNWYKKKTCVIEVSK